MGRRRAAFVGLVVGPIVGLVVGLTLLASPAVPAGAQSDGYDLPTSDEVVDLFDPLLEPLGLRTTRANLVSQDTGRYDDAGRHLAVYVEPTGEYTDEQYVKNFRKVTAIYLPKVFERWSDLQSFDVCQEPLASVDPSAEPAPITQIALRRKASKGVAWDRASLADLLTMAEQHRQDGTVATFSLFFADSVQDEPAYQRAQRAADRRTER